MTIRIKRKKAQVRRKVRRVRRSPSYQGMDFFSNLVAIPADYEKIVRAHLTVPRWPSEPRNQVRFFVRYKDWLYVPRGFTPRLSMVGVKEIHTAFKRKPLLTALRNPELRELFETERFVVESPNNCEAVQLIAELVFLPCWNCLRFVVVRNARAVDRVADKLEPAENSHNDSRVYRWPGVGNGCDFVTDGRRRVFPDGIRTRDVIVTTGYAAHEYLDPIRFLPLGGACVVVLGEATLTRTLYETLWHGSWGPTIGIVKPRTYWTDYDKLRRESVLGPTMGKVNPEFERLGHIHNLQETLDVSLGASSTSLVHRRSQLWSDKRWAQAVVHYIIHSLLARKTRDKRLRSFLKRRRLSIAVLVEGEAHGVILRREGLGEWSLRKRDAFLPSVSHSIFTLGGADLFKIDADVVVLADGGTIDFDSRFLSRAANSSRERYIVDLCDKHRTVSRLGADLVARFQLQPIRFDQPKDLPVPTRSVAWFDVNRSSFIDFNRDIGMRNVEEY